MKKLISIFLFFLVNVSLAQNQTNNWLFGDRAHMEFGSLTVNSINGSSLSAINGTSSISDFNGNLLFYTDGNGVWSRDNSPMRTPNAGPGVITTLNGDLNATQNCLIVPFPTDPQKYYIFTINVNEELRYSVVDMTLNNGFGQLAEVNTLVKNNVSGRLTAVHHDNGEDIWLAVNSRADSDARSYNFLNFFLISGNSITEEQIYEDEFLTVLDPQGQIKFSPDGTRLALTSTTGGLVFEFDSKTGTIKDSKRVSLSHPDDGPGAVTRPYGVAFSSNSRFVYFDSEAPFGGSRLAQWDALKDRNAQVFFIPRTKVPGALQLGKDGKIYNAVIGTNSISVINNPIGFDEDNIDFVENQFNLSPNSSARGLPSFVQSFFRTRIATNFGCAGKPTDMFVDSYSKNITAVNWDFGDGNTSNQVRPMHTFNAPGVYTVRATATINGGVINLVKNLNVYESPVLKANQKIIECDDNNDGYAVFNLLNAIDKITTPTGDEVFAFFETRNDADLGQNEIRLTTTYENTTPFQQELFFRSNSKRGCFSVESFTLETTFIELGGIDDEIVCEDSDNITGNAEGSLSITDMITKIRAKFNFDSSITLAFYPDKTSLEKDENAFQNSITAKSSEIWVKAEEAGSCSGLGKFNLVVNTTPPINLLDEYTICYDPSLKPPVIISADLRNERYEWKDRLGNIISTQQNFTLDKVGNYSLTVYKTENGLLCSNTKDFTVVNPVIPTFANIDVNTEDETNNIVTITIDGNSTYQFSLDNVNFLGNSTSYTFSGVEPGLRTVYIRDINNCENPIQTNVSVIGFRKYFTPNGDGDNDFWTIRGLDASNFKSINVSVFDRFGKIVFVLKDFNSIGWDGTYNGKPLNENNYWFRAEIVDKDNNLIRESGNFSLVRN